MARAFASEEPILSLDIDSPRTYDPARIRRKALKLKLGTRSNSSVGSRRSNSLTSIRPGVHALLDHWVFEVLMCVIILMNFAILAWDVDHMQFLEGHEWCDWKWFDRANPTFLTIFFMEFAMRFHARREEFWHYTWNRIDTAVIVIGVLEIVLFRFFGFSRGFKLLLNCVRLIRLGRFVHLLEPFPVLYSMMRSLGQVLNVIFWATVVLAVLLTMWSLLALVTIRPINKLVDHGGNEWCADAFLRLHTAWLYFFQTAVAGDSWGACAIPIMEIAPWTILIFGGTLVTVVLGATNLALAVIVEHAVEAREQDNCAVIKEKRQKRIAFTDKFREVIQTADSDDNGLISWQELSDSYEENEDLREALNLMDIDRDDVRNLFNLMGGDEDTGFNYEDLVSILQKAKCQDERIYLMVMKLQLNQVVSTMKDMQQHMAMLTNQRSNIPPSPVMHASLMQGTIAGSTAFTGPALDRTFSADTAPSLVTTPVQRQAETPMVTATQPMVPGRMAGQPGSPANGGYSPMQAVRAVPSYNGSVRFASLPATLISAQPQQPPRAS